MHTHIQAQRHRSLNYRKPSCTHAFTCVRTHTQAQESELWETFSHTCACTHVHTQRYRSLNYRKPSFTHAYTHTQRHESELWETLLHTCVNTHRGTEVWTTGNPLVHMHTHRGTGVWTMGNPLARTHTHIHTGTGVWTTGSPLADMVRRWIGNELALSHTIHNAAELLTTIAGRHLGKTLR